jgi:hypothetical protein
MVAMSKHPSAEALGYFQNLKSETAAVVRTTAV